MWIEKIYRVVLWLKELAFASSILSLVLDSQKSSPRKQTTVIRNGGGIFGFTEKPMFSFIPIQMLRLPLCIILGLLLILIYDNTQHERNPKAVKVGSWAFKEKVQQQLLATPSSTASWVNINWAISPLLCSRLGQEQNRKLFGWHL